MYFTPAAINLDKFRAATSYLFFIILISKNTPNIEYFKFLNLKIYFVPQYRLIFYFLSFQIFPYPLF